ncbi:hypothetical protein BpHYR1_028439 [Brachionus plicatilis]|uniref:Uncharacterized protein n=1 Tax=Brachionus plicatilis TaxID=10195 RepID=A0A3M7R2F1_BRAPC|nr:hypothetical protein BpHYR1_028439 [Brachionus plicatilis]
MSRIFGAWSNIDLTIEEKKISKSKNLKKFSFKKRILKKLSLIFFSSLKNVKILKPLVYVRPCTKYPIHGIKACVAKQGDTI